VPGGFVWEDVRDWGLTPNVQALTLEPQK